MTWTLSFSLVFIIMEVYSMILDVPWGAFHFHFNEFVICLIYNLQWSFMSKWRPNLKIMCTSNNNATAWEHLADWRILKIKNLNNKITLTIPPLFFPWKNPSFIWESKYSLSLEKYSNISKSILNCFWDSYQTQISVVRNDENTE